METTIRINTDLLTQEFIEGIQKLFPHKMVDITIHAADETEYILSNQPYTAELMERIEEYHAEMETTIRIKKNIPAFKELISLARELQKTYGGLISLKSADDMDSQFTDLCLIAPNDKNADITSLISSISDFPTLHELRSKAWKRN